MNDEQTRIAIGLAACWRAIALANAHRRVLGGGPILQLYTFAPQVAFVLFVRAGGKP